MEQDKQELTFRGCRTIQEAIVRFNEHAESFNKHLLSTWKPQPALNSYKSLKSIHEYSVAMKNWIAGLDEYNENIRKYLVLIEENQKAMEHWLWSAFEYGELPLQIATWCWNTAKNNLSEQPDGGWSAFYQLLGDEKSKALKYLENEK